MALRESGLSDANGERFSAVYRRLTAPRCAVAEARAGEEAAPPHVREKIVRCLWFDQLLDPHTLRAEDGRSVTVFSPGYWNGGSGPDFHNAEIAFDGQDRLRGDVEIHVDASDWRRHGHSGDPGYDRVILHVVLRNDLGTATLADGDREIPQLALQDHLSSDLNEILDRVEPDWYPRISLSGEGPCCRAIRACARDDAWVGRFLDIAGDERILLKAERFASRIAKSTPDEVMYESLMECMGYSNNRGPFRRLAQALTLSDLKRLIPLDAPDDERAEAVEALLCGAGGFLDTETEDEESQAKLARLRAWWQSSERHVHGARMERSQWRFKGVRPVNYPARRIAGIAAFLARHAHVGLCRAILTAIESVPREGSEASRCRKTLDKFCGLFEDEPSGYWARRVTFGPQRLGRDTRLIGRTRATEMVVNVVVPLLLAISREQAKARIEPRLHNVYSSLRPLSENAVTRYMKTRIFGAAQEGRSVVSTIRRQQGLLQVFHDFCESESTTCEACGFLATVEAGTR